MKIKFNPYYRKVSDIKTSYFPEIIKNEPMLFQADYSFAKEQGGTLTNIILDKLEQDFIFTQKRLQIIDKSINLVIDTRVNMLTKGVYPSIPGWHCDDVPRNNRHSQPDFNRVSNDITHFLVVLSDTPNVSGTEFITSTHEFDIDKNNVWKSLNKKIKDYELTNRHKTLENKLRTQKLKSGEILEFNQLAIHRATPALKYGWRLFFRASFTYRKPTNEIRNQTQVYYDINNAGW